MESQDRPPRPSNPPALPPSAPPPPPGPDPWTTGRRAPGPGSTPPWVRRFRPRSVRGAVGLGLLGAALLLLPFLDDPDRWWIPIGLGFGTLVLLYLLRLDKLLVGWAPHVAGLVLVASLVWATSANPFAWGLAVGVGVVLAGVLLLPRWQVLAAGAVLLVVAGIGYQFRSVELADRAEAQMQQTQAESKGQLGAPTTRGVLPLLLSNIARNNSGPICDNLLSGESAAAFAVANRASDCRAAVAQLHGSVTDPDRYGSGSARIEERGPVVLIDGCSIRWRSSASAGPQIGYLTAGRTTGTTYVITGFRPCS